MYNYSASIFKYAVQQKYISDNPATLITLPKKKERKTANTTPNFWTKEQLQTFFNFIDPKNELEHYTLFRLLAFTGIRRGECLALTWSDLNTQKNTLSINKTLAQGVRGKHIVNDTKTHKGTRQLSIDNTTMNYLKKWKLEQRKTLLKLGFNANKRDQLIFATLDNAYKSLNTPRKWLYEVLDREDCNLPTITIHGFRHSHASALFSAGASIKEVQERLGHEDAQTTLNIYTHVTERQDKEAVDKLVNFLDF